MRNSSHTVGSGGSGGSGGSTVFFSTLSSLASSKSASASASNSVNSSPSFVRRRALKEADDTANQLRVVDCYPLSKYIEIADKLFGYFEEAFECLHLNDAYVYGMRFAELAITNIPKHKDWATTAAAAAANGGGGGTAEEKLKSQIVKVVSRLEIIKRRMDEEESKKLRTGMLAQAEEEVRMKNLFDRERREQEQRNNSLIPAVIGEVYQFPAIPQQIDTTTTITSQPHTKEDDLMSDDDDNDGSDGSIVNNNNNVPSTEIKGNEKAPVTVVKSARSKLRQFLRIPKNVTGLMSSSTQPNEVSQPIVPSIDAIRQSQSQHWQQQQQ